MNSNIWGGRWIEKHRMYTGDIEKHIELKSVTLLDDDERSQYMSDFMDIDELPEDDEIEIAVIGEGEYAYMVKFGFMGEGSTLYEIVVQSPHLEPDAVVEDVMSELGHHLTTVG